MVLSTSQKSTKRCSPSCCDPSDSQSFKICMPSAHELRNHPRRPQQPRTRGSARRDAHPHAERQVAAWRAFASGRAVWCARPNRVALVGSRTSVSQAWAAYGRLDAQDQLRTTKENNTAVVEQLRLAPPHQRGTVRAAAATCGVPHVRVWRMVKDGALRPHSSATKSLLDESERAQRIIFCSSFVDRERMRFHDMFDFLHLDEKWFYVSAPKRRYYLVADEADPLRLAKSKRFVTKMMFLVAVARPCVDKSSGDWFDGKVGLWPLTTQQPAARTSRNRPRGTLVTKPIKSVTSSV